MKKTISILFSLWLIAQSLFAQNSGKVIESRMIKSPILGKDVRCTFYLPPNYDASDRTYPVVYLLHGYSDDDTGWLQFGEINRLADQAIASGEIPPMIIVMPDAGVSWYVNSYDGKVRYEDFMIKELIPYVESNFRAKKDKRYRGIAGLSMGGFGTMVLALHNPDLFVAAAPLSAAFAVDQDYVNTPEDRYENVFGILYGKGLKGNDRLSEAYYKNSCLKIVENAKVEDLRKVRYWIDCGDDDFLYKGNSLMHNALRDKNIPHEFRVREGGHTWTYWRTGIIDALKFIGISFRQQ